MPVNTHLDMVHGGEFFLRILREKILYVFFAAVIFLSAVCTLFVYDNVKPRYATRSIPTVG